MGGFSYVKRKSSLSDYTPQDFFFLRCVTSIPRNKTRILRQDHLLFSWSDRLSALRGADKENPKGSGSPSFFFHTVSIESHLPEKKKRKTFFLLMKITEFFSC